MNIWYIISILILYKRIKIVRRNQEMMIDLKKKKKIEEKYKKGIVSPLQKVISFELSQDEMTPTI